MLCDFRVLGFWVYFETLRLAYFSLTRLKLIFPQLKMKAVHLCSSFNELHSSSLVLMQLSAARRMAGCADKVINGLKKGLAISPQNSKLEMAS